MRLLRGARQAVQMLDALLGRLVRLACADPRCLPQMGANSYLQQVGIQALGCRRSPYFKKRVVFIFNFFF